MAVRTLPASAVVGTGGPPTQPYWHFAVCPLLLVEEWWKVSSLLSLSDNTQSTDGSFLLVSKESKKVVWKISCLFTPAKLARAEDYIVSASVWLEWSVARPHLFALFLGKQTSCHFIFLWLLVILHLRLPQHLALFLVTQSRPTLCEPMDYSPPGSSVLGDSPGKNTGVGCHALLQGIIPTQASNPGLPHCRQILCGCLSHQANPPVSGGIWPRSWAGTSRIAGRFSASWASRGASLAPPTRRSKDPESPHRAVPQIPTDMSGKQAIFFLRFRDIPGWIILFRLGFSAIRQRAFKEWGGSILEEREGHEEKFLWEIFLSGDYMCHIAP